MYVARTEAMTNPGNSTVTRDHVGGFCGDQMWSLGAGPRGLSVDCKTMQEV